MPTEVNTPDKFEYIFYAAPGGRFAFKIRAANDAHLALTSGPHESDPMFEVILGGWSNTKSVIRKKHTVPDIVEANTPGILNAGEFRGFWLRWYDNVITVGREGEAAAFLSWKEPGLFPGNYLGICTGNGANGTWLFDEGTVLETIGLEPSSDSGPGYWVPAADGAVPPGSMEGGFDINEQLYIARAVHGGALIPGKLHPKYKLAYIASGGAEHEHNEYEVLCASGGSWMPASGANISRNALPGGKTETGETLYIGRVTHRGVISIGKIQPSHRCCYISYGGREYAYSDFEVFVSN